MKTKKAIVTSVVFLILAAVLFVGGMSLLGWNFAELDVSNYIEKAYEFPADAQTITSIDIDTWLGVEVTCGDEFALKYYDTDESTAEVYIEDGKLVLNQERTRKWWNFFSFSTNKVQLTIPQNVDLDIDVTNLTFIGNGVSLGALEIDATNANYDLKNCTGKELKIEGVNIVLKMYETTFGDVILDGANNNVEIVKSTLNSYTQFGVNDNVRLNDSNIASITVDSTNITVTADKLIASKLKLDATNMTVKVCLIGAKSEYNISGKTVNGNLPLAQHGTNPDKIIQIDSVNFGGFIKFA